MVTYIKTELNTRCTLHWWNLGSKTLVFKGTLRELLKHKGISYTKRKTEYEGLFLFTFKNDNGIRYKKTGQIHDFRHLAKQFIQMDLVRMGDKSTLDVAGSWRPTVTVNH